MYETQSLKRQIQNRFSLLIVLTILTVGSVLTLYLSTKQIRESVEHNREIVTLIQRELDLYFLRILDIMRVAGEHELVLSCVERSKAGFAWRSVDFLRSLLIDHPEIKDLILLNKAGYRVVSTGGAVRQGYNFYQQPWLYGPKARSLREALFLNPHEESYYVEGGANNEVVSLLLPIGEADIEANPTDEAALLCNISISELETITASLSGLSKATLAIYDGEGNVLFPQISAPLQGKRDFTVVRAPSQLTGWRVVMSIPRDSLLANLKIAIYIIILGIVVALGVSLLFAARISSTISMPVEDMAGRMSRIGRGDYSISLEDHGVATELTDLGRNIDKMVRHILESQNRVRESQLISLQEQVNPHFLFNALQTVKNLTIDNRGADIRKVTDRLGELLRYGLNNPWVPVRLDEEIIMVENYLEIQGYRFPGAFEFQKDIPPVLVSTPVLKLILQPLVENSLLHGMAPDRRLIIRLTAYRESNAVVLVLADDGRGMDNCQLAKLMDELEPPVIVPGEHIGLVNVKSDSS